MSKLKMLMLSLSLTLAAGTIISCGGNSSAESTTEQQGKEYTSAYICPMHCEGSGSDEAGKCPVCGMDYVANTEHKAGDGHDH